MLVEALDKAGHLESEVYRARLEERRREYAEAPQRPARHAGGAYPETAEQARNYLKEILVSAQKEGARQIEGVRALVAPHIDFARGALGYGFAYGALNPDRPPACVVVLGTGHAIRERTFVLTEKDFATPLGTVRTNRSLLQRLVDRCGAELVVDQHEHLQEHSVEFQAIFLRHLFGDSIEFLPVLCGAFPLAEPGGDPPEEVDEISRFLDELRNVLSERAGDYLVVAGVDFAHVGPRFGAPQPVDRALLEEVARSDHDLLDAACRGDANEFYRLLARDGNRHNVCGHAAIYTLLSVLPDLAGEVLHYDQAVRPDGSETVTFAAAAFR
jgi:AmmeMemoRadiSam system protein B